MSNVCLYAYSQSTKLHYTKLLPNILWPRKSYIDFSIFKAFLQIIIYGFIRDFADQCEIGDADLLLLRRVECCFLDIRFAAAPGRPATTTRRIVRGFLPFWTTTDTLDLRRCQCILDSKIACRVIFSHHLQQSLPSRPFTASGCAEFQTSSW